MKRESLTLLAPERKTYERIFRAADSREGYVPKVMSEGLMECLYFRKETGAR